MTKSHSDNPCACCGALLPEGRQFTCNDRCEAAYNESANAYLEASKLAPYGFEDPSLSSRILQPYSDGIDWLKVAAAYSRLSVLADLKSRR